MTAKLTYEELEQRVHELESEVFERKRTEIPMLESEAQKKAILDGITTNLAFVNENLEILWANKTAADSVNRTVDDMIGRKCYELWADPDSPCDDCPTAKAFKTKKTEQTIIHAPDGRIWEEKGEPVFDGKGRLIGVLEIAHDITARARAEEALRESEEKYRSLVESTNDSIYVVNRNCTYLFMNRRHLSRLDVPEDNATGKTYREFHSESDTQEFIKKVDEVFASDAPQQHEHESHRDGKHFLRTLSPIIGPDGRTEAVTVVSTDITDRVQAEEERLKLQDQLQRAQKMEAMGLMAGGVAHDLNNILSGIVSYPELLLLNLPEDSPLRKPIKTIQESGMRAADVVADLMTIARGVANSKEVLNLNTMVEEYLASAEYQKLENIHPFVHFKTEPVPDLLNMSGSPIHIKKILMNLVTNASEAIHDSGTVTIGTVNQYLDEPLKGHADVRTGEYAVLSVSDDGSGIAPKDLEKIFEPFYTKKVMGRSGTGLGLAVVWNIVQDHNGYINVESSEKGTVFELYFPLTRDEVTAEKKKVPLEDYLGHGEKILVVDDDERQREIAGGMLTELAYNTEAVSSGEEAIEYLKENQVDLIVLDMVMPKGMNGRETYEEIIKIRPGQKAIIASGFSETEEVKMARKSGAGNYIKKPYILEKIGLAVKEELEK